MRVGQGAGNTGVYDLSDPAGSGGTLTGHGLSTGSMTAGGNDATNGRLYVGDGATGTVNVNTTGTLRMRNRLYVATGNGGVGTVNIDAGTVPMGNDLVVGEGTNCTGTVNLGGGTMSTGGWNFFGNGNGCTGTLNQTGGTFTNTGRTYVGGRHAGVTSSGTGNYNISGGTNTSNGEFAVGSGNLTAATNSTLTISGNAIVSAGKTSIGGTPFDDGNANPGKGTATISGSGTLNVNGEFWVGQSAGSVGVLNVNGGTINVNNWIALGRRTGTATVNMTGGTWNKTGASQFIVGADGPATMTMSGGLVDVQGGFTWIGEAGGATTATLTISGSAEFRTPTMSVGQSAPNAILNLDGGTLRTLRINGAREQNDTGATGGTGTVNFNGTQIVATADNITNFISNTLDNAVIGTGGLLVDSNGFNLVVPKSLSGTGGVVKSGAGTLTLSGGSSYGGNNVLGAGTLNLNASSSGTGSITTADGTTLGLNAPFPGDQLTASAATLGTSGDTTLNLNLGDFNGTNSTNSILDVTGALTLNGVVTVNVSGAKFAVGDIPLITSPAAAVGSGSFQLGTLPAGVVATLETAPNYLGSGLTAVYLDVTSVALPEWDGTNEVVIAKFGDTLAASADITVNNASGIVVGQEVRGTGIPTGAVVAAISGLTITLDQAATATGTFVDFDFVATAGTNEGVWDTTTQNWVDQVTALSSLYADPNPVLFSDLATGPTDVVLDIPVAPSEVTFNNSTLVYSLSGTGEITGDTGLLKQGSAGLTVNNTNSYTGVTRLEGGTTTVAALTNGGVAGPLGAASNAPANLVLAGGTLDYTGGALTWDRGLTIDGNSGLVNAGNLSISGQLARTSGGITKTGAGSLTLTNSTNAIGAFRVNGGSLVFDSSGGPQTNTSNGLFLGAGVTVDLPNDTTLANAGDVNIGDVVGATSTFTLSGNAVFSSTNRVMTGMGGAGADGAILVSGSSQFNMTGGWLSVGETGNGSLTVKDSGTFSMAVGDFNITDLANSTATLTLQDSGTINAVWTYWGKNTGTVADVFISGGTFNTSSEHYVASGGGSSATVTQTGGTVNMNGGYNPIGRAGTAEWNLSAGTVNSNGWSIIGRDTTGIGTLNVSGGVYNQTQLDRPLMIGEFGSGTLTVSGTGEVNSNGNNGLILANEPSGTGIVNLDGGTLTVKRVREGNDGNAGAGGSTTFHFNGGVLKAGAGANANFMSGLDLVDILSGGGTIDSNGNTINVAQSIGGSGALTKTGTGTLTFTGVNTYGGNTTVVDGILSITAPNLGNFTTVTIGTVPLSPAVLDLPNAGTDRVSGLVIDGAPVGPGVYGALGSGAPNETDAITGNGFLEVGTPSAYDSWVAGPGGAFPGSNDPAVIGLDADPDSDGQPNSLEFALGGSPDDGADNAKVYHFAADSSDGGTAEELLMTIAVRNGGDGIGANPVFAPATGGTPTAMVDGVTYMIEGGLDLTFADTVSVVTTVTTDLPAPPAGYEYRTFSLDGSDGLPSKGFLRVNVTP